MYLILLILNVKRVLFDSDLELSLSYSLTAVMSLFSTYVAHSLMTLTMKTDLLIVYSPAH